MTFIDVQKNVTSFAVMNNKIDINNVFFAFIGSYHTFSEGISCELLKGIKHFHY